MMIYSIINQNNKITITKMVIVRIVNQPDEINQYSQNNILYYTILGINPFLNSLQICLDDSKKLNVYLFGETQHFLSHIIWNQYFNNTLLKQAYHFVTENCSSDYSFLKINGTTYRLADCLKWSNANKFMSDIQKCKCFSVQGFMSDGTMKKINFQIGKHPNPENYDIVFKYQFNKDIGFSTKKSKRKSSYSQSFSSTGRKRNYSTAEININNATSNQKTKSKKKVQAKKLMETDRKDRKFIYTDSSASRSNFKSMKNSFKPNSQLKNSNACQLQSFFPAENDTQLPFSEQKTKIKGKVEKQEVIGQILRQKEGKLKENQKMFKDQEQKYSKRIFQQEQQHKMEMQEIKSEVEQVLGTYKKKNKELAKQNECLSDLNVKLMNNIEKSDNRLKNVSVQLQKIKKQKEQISLQNQNNKREVEQLRQENIKNKEQHNEQKRAFSMTLKEKEKKAHDYKKKYEQMMENMRKLVSFGVPQSPQPLGSKENNF